LPLVLSLGLFYLLRSAELVISSCATAEDVKLRRSMQEMLLSAVSSLEGKVPFQVRGALSTTHALILPPSLNEE